MYKRSLYFAPQFLGRNFRTVFFSPKPRGAYTHNENGSFWKLLVELFPSVERGGGTARFVVPDLSHYWAGRERASRAKAINGMERKINE